MKIQLAEVFNTSEPYGEVIIIVVALVSLFKLLDHIINGDNDKRK